MRNRKLLPPVSIIYSIYIALLVVLLPSLAPYAMPAPAQPAKNWPTTMTIAVSDPGNTAHILGITLAKLIDEKLKIRTTVTVAGTEE